MYPYVYMYMSSLCPCLCILYMYICMCLCLCLCKCIGICICIWVHLYAFIYTRLSIYVYIYNIYIYVKSFNIAEIIFFLGGCQSWNPHLPSSSSRCPIAMLVTGAPFVPGATWWRWVPSLALHARADQSGTWITF
jgi:hypothetical protein